VIKGLAGEEMAKPRKADVSGGVVIVADLRVLSSSEESEAGLAGRLY